MDLSADHILVVFLLTTLAGLATGIGGFIAFFMKRTDTKTLTFALGLSGGVMVYISLVELLGEAQHRLIEFEGHTAGSWIAIASFFGGIAVAVPLYYGTGSRKKALFYSFLSGLAEPVGAAIAMFFLFHFLTPTVLAVLFASVAGIMVFISFDELLPMAERWGHHHISIMGIIAGMLLMAIVLI